MEITFKKILVLIDPEKTLDLVGLGVYDLRLLKVDKSTVIPLATMIIGGLQSISHHVIIIIDARSFLLQNVSLIESYELMGDVPQGQAIDYLYLNKLIIENQKLLIQINSLTKNKRKESNEFPKTDR